jgi:hypothetical protein
MKIEVESPKHLRTAYEVCRRYGNKMMLWLDDGSTVAFSVGDTEPKNVIRFELFDKTKDVQAEINNRTIKQSKMENVRSQKSKHQTPQQ